MHLRHNPFMRLPRRLAALLPGVSRLLLLGLLLGGQAALALHSHGADLPRERSAIASPRSSQTDAAPCRACALGAQSRSVLFNAACAVSACDRVQSVAVAPVVSSAVEDASAPDARGPPAC
jgi:hypothetical protein